MFKSFAQIKGFTGRKEERKKKITLPPITLTYTIILPNISLSTEHAVQGTIQQNSIMKFFVLLQFVVCLLNLYVNSYHKFSSQYFLLGWGGEIFLISHNSIFLEMCLPKRCIFKIQHMLYLFLQHHHKNSRYASKLARQPVLRKEKMLEGKNW